MTTRPAPLAPSRCDGNAFARNPAVTRAQASRAAPGATTWATAFAVALALQWAPVPASAADDPPAPATPAARPAADPLGAARKLIAEKRYGAAIDELKRVNATNSADWNNLMGFTHRKASAPDLAAAERHYAAALRIDPNHRGALEYSGELFLMQGNLAGAEQRLAALTKVCGNTKCEELEDLKGAIAQFKANGNRHVPRTY